MTDENRPHSDEAPATPRPRPVASRVSLFARLQAEQADREARYAAADEARRREREAQAARETDAPPEDAAE
jgi:hypothetical protein